MVGWLVAENNLKWKEIVRWLQTLLGGSTPDAVPCWSPEFFTIESDWTKDLSITLHIIFWLHFQHLKPCHRQTSQEHWNDLQFQDVIERHEIYSSVSKPSNFQHNWQLMFLSFILNQQLHQVTLASSCDFNKWIWIIGQMVRDKIKQW